MNQWLSLGINIKNNSWWPVNGWRVCKKSSVIHSLYSEIFSYACQENKLIRFSPNKITKNIPSNYVVNDWRDKLGWQAFQDRIWHTAPRVAGTFVFGNLFSTWFNNFIDDKKIPGYWACTWKWIWRLISLAPPPMLRILISDFMSSILAIIPVSLLSMNSCMHWCSVELLRNLQKDPIYLLQSENKLLMEDTVFGFLYDVLFNYKIIFIQLFKEI